MTLTFGWPQILLSALIFSGVGIAMARYGQQKKEPYDITDVLIGPAIVFFLLWWGGFFGQ